jgi:hypothetical protein
MSRLKPPSAGRASRGTLSKVSGGGTGSALIVFAEAIPFSPQTRLLMQASAPWAALGVAAAGPHISEFLASQARSIRLHFLLYRSRRLLRQLPANAPNRPQVEKNVAELETMISDLINVEARALSGHVPAPTPAPAANVGNSHGPPQEQPPNAQAGAIHQTPLNPDQKPAPH